MGSGSPYSSTLRPSTSHLTPSHRSLAQAVLPQLQKLHEMREQQLEEVILQLQKPCEARAKSNPSCCLLPTTSQLLPTPAWAALKEDAAASKAHSTSRFLTPMVGQEQPKMGQEQEATEL